MAKKVKSIEEQTLDIHLEIESAQIEFYLWGDSPLLMNRKSEQVKQSLLLPPMPKNKAERLATLKHEPREEFRNAVYKFRGDDEPTRLLMPAGAFKDAIAEAALRTPGATKTEVSQLVQVIGINVPIYGIPLLHMADVKQGGRVGAPDIRTRACLWPWCAAITVKYFIPLVTMNTVTKLVSISGILMGVGDGRPEKGKLTHGTFGVVDDDDKRWHELVKKAGRVAQDRALANPASANEETEALLAWYDEELKRRRTRPPAEASKKARPKKMMMEHLVEGAMALHGNNGKAARQKKEA
jgi:hypothetical protein